MRISSQPTLSPQAPQALVGLAWAGLLYTWVLGDWPQSFIGNSWGTLLQTISGETFCLFKHLTHLPCCFCGLTRSFIHIQQGQLAQSVDYHPLGLPIFVLVCLLAFIGPFYPKAVNAFLRKALRKTPIMIASGLLLGCWLWKIGHSPYFW